MKTSKLTARVGSAFGFEPGLQTLTRCAALSAVGAMLAFVPAAQAVVVLSAAANVAVPATTAGVYINVVSGVSNIAPASAPGWDINPWGSTTMAFFTPTAAGSATGGSYVTGANTTVASLLAGTTIGPASTFTSSATGVTFGALANQWTLNATNYFGFRFIGDDTLLHYGYGTMLMGASVTARTVGQLWYESDANTGITIVPEPSTSAMLLGGLAAAAALARRRRPAAIT